MLDRVMPHVRLFTNHSSVEVLLGEAIKRILVVDDEENTRIGLSKLLTQEGFEVDSAADGNEALDYLGQQKVNLVISDINIGCRRRLYQ